ncbi:AMP-binding protein [Lachnoclostridium pacaense]|uniref:AMP-dependent synthetase/ligase n=1 Tax=Enterocloster hominis (ex Hitch et al. 2024) TaxID=1917870 RepID=UPI001D0F7A20|nr:AMP-binding protein [Lachnoclostridium pacaense]MCC2817728.1 AMP-binding protein [Lachnoclostridium pacaense]MCC2877262.1 AMP-binding protein [Lachnoclostridium pacaense]
MPVGTLRDIIRHGADAYGSQTAFRYKVKKEIVDRTYLDVNRDSMAVSRMLESMGMEGKHIALIGTTTYQWIVGYFGIVGSGSVAVPIDAQLPADAVCELLERADVEMLIFDEIRRDVAKAVKEKCPSVRYIVSMQAEEAGDGIQSLSMLMALHAGEYEKELSGDQLATILFTSGTTGKSKGVMLSHRNLVDNAVCLDMKIPAGTVSMTLLPINHVYCLTMDIIKGLHIGLVICINDSIMHVQRNMKLFKPEIVLLVPLVIESIYGKLKDAGSLIPKKMVAKAAFGGNLRIICSGGAYLDPDYVDKFKEYGITILQGYGMTECSPVISTNLEWENKKGSVGKLLPNCEAKVVDEEIWVRGSSVMQGYYKMPEQTAETLEDGWLKTGDLGYVDEDNFVYITGRRKNLIILANGENVSPEELENQLSRSELVKEILVREKDKVIEAEIFPDYEYAKKKHVKDVEGKLQELVDDFNKDMPVYKRIYSLIVRETEFEKTPSKKIKRF